MKRYVTPGTAVLVLVAAAVGTLSCGTEPIGTNDTSDEYIPASAGDKWSYTTYNLRLDPNRAMSYYTQVSLENVPPADGGQPALTYVTKYDKRSDGQGFRLDQAGYWVNKDISYKLDYFDYGTQYFLLNGYHYLDQFREPVIGTIFTDGNGNLAPETLFVTPFQTDDVWDVLNRGNPDPTGNPTVYRDISQEDYFGMLRDMDHDGVLDSMDLSIIGRVEKTELLNLENGKQVLCYKIVHTQTIVFHLSNDGDVTDVSRTNYWVAPHVGFVKVLWYDGSNYLDAIEMTLTDWWFVK